MAYFCPHGHRHGHVSQSCVIHVHVTLPQYAPHDLTHGRVTGRVVQVSIPP
ncbi:hypothetical protein F383_28400 [Gossypium arboreum]|uniref:Uncharacterized protein n=1 Tax=Gossypium arboreum TaxID=29729 RepID=A0A0B0MNK0_GOSAR|nr:hypothetical protein F383_28400 [Gossypium arboreum]